MINQAIGIFDSGVGGTSIWKEIHKQMPLENTLFLADSKNAPYGKKSKQKIIDLCKKNTELLLNRGSKIIVVACNTATTNAILLLREEYKIPFIGIEPAIKPAALQTKTGVVGVLATQGTLTSELFHKTSLLYGNGITVVEQIGEDLVPIIEAGDLNSEKLKTLLLKYLTPMLENGMDHLVLGCTHYPYLIPVIEEILPKEIKIIDSGEAVARQTRSVLSKEGLLNTDKTGSYHCFYSNGNAQILKSFVSEVEGDVVVEYLDF